MESVASSLTSGVLSVRPTLVRQRFLGSVTAAFPCCRSMVPTFRFCALRVS
jgi:hypothetical protein